MDELLTVPVDAQTTAPAAGGASLTLVHVLSGMGGSYDPPIRLEDIHIIRHSFRPGDPEGLQGPEDLTEERVLAYTREQDPSPRRFPETPPRYWVILIADSARRSSLWGTFENHGEAERNVRRLFQLHLSGFLAPLFGRLVVEWDNPRSWHRRASAASVAKLPVLEIADRDKVRSPDSTACC